ncbi:ubiquitin recognition factor in ER-associated degradation protein 1-like [Lepeophtheirus salmonis]|uniref:ubiquitin recognition factor in ER-associated degradation protein 1-like n=1 Tax=Lepeophtheirus salmonis TaxID=72036 RepID=UPI003AF3E801
MARGEPNIFDLKVKSLNSMCEHLELYDYGGRIFLPVNVLQKVIRFFPDEGNVLSYDPPSSLASEEENKPPHMLFKLIEKEMGRVLFVGVLEFTAPLGHVKEKEWVKVEYLKVHPPVGISVIFKPVSKGFSMIDDPKSLLEAKLRHFSVMSEGEILPIQYRDSIHELEVVETNPKDVIDIVNIDLEVIFVKSLQSEAEEDGSSDNDSSVKSHEGIPDYDWVFLGQYSSSDKK